MFGNRAVRERIGPAGVLSEEGIARLLWPLRYPMYSNLAIYLQRLGYRLWLRELWRELWDESPPGEWTTDTLEYEIAWRINDTMFPLNFNFMDELWGNEEEVMCGYIPWDGFRVPWELGGMKEAPNWAEPVVAAIAPLLMATIEGVYDEDSLSMSMEDWCERRGYETPSYNEIDADYKVPRLREGLAALPSPLDGLAVALDVVTGNTGNVWLDTPELYAAAEYDEDAIWGYCWETDGIRRLEAAYREARPRLDRLEAYQKWYSFTRDAEAQVMTLLCHMVDYRWHVNEEGRVILDG